MEDQSGRTPGRETARERSRETAREATGGTPSPATRDAPSYRRRAVSATALVGTVAAVTLIGVVQLVFSGSAREAADRVLIARTDAVIRSIEATSSGHTLNVPGEQLGPGVAVYDEAGSLIAGSAPRALADRYEELATVSQVTRVKENGAEVVARAKPDGYTLLLSGSTHLVGAALHAGRLSFDPLNDFTDIGLVAEQANVLVVHPSLAANNLAELLALARSEPKKLNYASSGNGSSQHLFGALLFSMTGVALTHVPYKGSGPAMADLLSGLVPVSVPAISNAIGHIQAGKLRALGVTSLKRSPALPNVPSLDELGVKGYDATLWFALMGPKGLPREIVNKIWESLVIALGSPEVAKPYAQQGVDVRMMPPAEFSAFNRVEAAKWARIVKVSGATVD